jgi:CheY-like chemotaxis protein
MGKPLSGQHILVVEDEMLNLMMIEDMLTDLGGASVSAAATVDKALALIERQVFDIAMLDLNLNGIKSYPVAETLTARGVPFVFATGYSEHALGDRYRGRPMLKKPFKYEALVDSLTRLLACQDNAVKRRTQP